MSACTQSYIQTQIHSGSSVGGIIQIFKYSSDVVLHFHEVGGLTEDRLKQKWPKLAEISRLLVCSMGQAPKILNPAIPTMQLSSDFH